MAPDDGFSVGVFFVDCADGAADAQTTAGVAVDAVVSVDAVDSATTQMIFGVYFDQ